MKKILFRTGLAILAAGLTASTARAQGNVITVDELFPAELMTQGGIWTSNGHFMTSLTSHIGADPSGSGLASVLYYDLPALFATALPGDVQIIDGPWETQFTNDIIRFDGNGHLIFYSNGDGAVGGADLSVADYATILNNSVTNSLLAHVVINEVGTELNNWANYNPVGGSGPGYVGGGPAGGTPSYLFISDVPEPGLLTLAGSGFATLLFIARWRRSK